MKQLLKYTILLVTLVLAGSCTQNDGHIGELFGSWTLESMTCNGASASLPEGTYTMASFQNDIVVFYLYTDEYTEPIGRHGTWTRQGDELNFNFTYSGSDIAAGTGIYSAPDWLHFPQNCVFPLHIERLDGSHLNVSYSSDTNGDVYTYKFVRTW